MCTALPKATAVESEDRGPEDLGGFADGSDFWHTAPAERLGIPAIMVSDGPHGLRAQLEQGDHVGLLASAPATCFPTASALASSWTFGPSA